MLVKRNKRKRTVNTKRRPVTRSFSKLPGANECSKYFPDKTVRGSIHEKASRDSELNIIAEAFDDNFSLVDQHGLSPEKSAELPTHAETGNHDNSSNSDVLYCYSSCTLGRKYDRSMIQCFTCMTWCHTECANLESEHSSTWNCEKCRCIPETICLLNNQMNEMHNLLSVMVEKQNSLYEQFCFLLNKNDKLESEIKLLKSQNFKLRLHGYNTLSSESSESDTESVNVPGFNTSANFSDADPTETSTVPEPDTMKESDVEIVDITQPDQIHKSTQKLPDSYKHNLSACNKVSNMPCARKKKLTLLGGSMVRGTGQALSTGLPHFDTMVYSTSGLKIQQAVEQSSKVFADHDAGDLAMLQVGTCDLTVYSSEELINKYVTLIDSVRVTAPEAQVIVTAVPYRLSAGSREANMKADILNDYLKSLCSTSDKLLYIDANPPRNAANYHSDGLHFSFNGRSFYGQFISKYITHSLNFPQPNILTRM